MYEHQWNRLREADPEHSRRYSERWQRFIADGVDIDGEARAAMALVAPGARVLDAGCGTGRVGGYLAERGYRVVGIDLDETLVAEAAAAYPQGEWHVGDLAQFDAAALAGDPGFDLVLSAGNVLAFLDPAARRPALARLAEALAPAGRLVTGFGAGRGYAFADYENDLAAVGLDVQHRYATWNLHPYVAGESDFLVCVAGRA